MRENDRKILRIIIFIFFSCVLVIYMQKNEHNEIYKNLTKYGVTELSLFNREIEWDYLCFIPAYSKNPKEISHLHLDVGFSSSDSVSSVIFIKDKSLVKVDVLPNNLFFDFSSSKKKCFNKRDKILFSTEKSNKKDVYFMIKE